MTIRRQTFLLLLVAVLAGSALTAVVAATLTGRALDRTANQRVVRQVQALATAIDAAPPRSPSATGPLVFLAEGPRFVPVDARRDAAEYAAARAAVAAGARDGSVVVRGRRVAFAAQATRTSTVVLLRRGSALGPDFTPYAIAIVVATLAGIALAGSLGWILSRRIAAPISTLAQATARLAGGRERQSVPERGTVELVELAGSFNRMAGDLERAREAEATFLLSISHELRTPLTSIRGFAEGLVDGVIEPGRAGGTIGEEAHRLESLIDDLFELADVRRSSFTVAPTPVPLARVAAAVLGRYRDQSALLGLALDVVAIAPVTVAADEGRLVQVVSNLVENALRCTPRGGQVTIEVTGATIAVRDTGPGLDAEDAERAFERFFLAGKYRLSRPVGSGLGLAIVDELSQAMGATLAVDGAPGGGTTIAVSLPPVPPVPTP